MQLSRSNRLTIRLGLSPLYSRGLLIIFERFMLSIFCSGRENLLPRSIQNFDEIDGIGIIK